MIILFFPKHFKSTLTNKIIHILNKLERTKKKKQHIFKDKLRDNLFKCRRIEHNVLYINTWDGFHEIIDTLSIIFHQRWAYTIHMWHGFTYECENWRDMCPCVTSSKNATIVHGVHVYQPILNSEKGIKLIC